MATPNPRAVTFPPHNQEQQKPSSGSTGKMRAQMRGRRQPSAEMPDYRKYQFSFKATNGGILGPMGFGKLQRLYKRKQISTGTMIWMSGQEHQGATAESFPGLLDALDAERSQETAHGRGASTATKAAHGSTVGASAKMTAPNLPAKVDAASSAHRTKSTEAEGGMRRAASRGERSGHSRLNGSGMAEDETADSAVVANDAIRMDGDGDLPNSGAERMKSTGESGGIRREDDRSAGPPHPRGPSSVFEDGVGRSRATGETAASESVSDEKNRKVAHELALVMKKLIMWSINNETSGVAANGASPFDPQGRNSPAAQRRTPSAELLKSLIEGSARAGAVVVGGSDASRPRLHQPAGSLSPSPAALRSDNDAAMHPSPSIPGPAHLLSRRNTVAGSPGQRRRSSVMPSLRKAMEKRHSLSVDIEKLEEEAHVMEVKVNSMPSTPVFQRPTNMPAAENGGSASTLNKGLADELVALLSLKQEMKSVPTVTMRKRLLLRAIAHLASRSAPDSSRDRLRASPAHSIGQFGISRCHAQGDKDAVIEAMEVRIMVMGELLQTACELIQDEEGADGDAAHRNELDTLTDHYSGLSERFEDCKRQNSFLHQENTIVHDEIKRLRANLLAMSPSVAIGAPQLLQQTPVPFSPASAAVASDARASDSRLDTNHYHATPPPMSSSRRTPHRPNERSSASANGSGAERVPASKATTPLRSLLVGDTESDLRSEKSVHWSDDGHGRSRSKEKVPSKDIKAILGSAPGMSRVDGGVPKDYPFRHSRQAGYIRKV